MNFKVEGFGDLIASGPTYYFAITCEGLQPIIERTYNIICLENRSFQKLVSRSVFSYYIWQHLYARIIALKEYDGEATYEETEMSQYILCEKYVVPEIIYQYLESIGNVEDCNGIECKIRFPVWPNDDGDFGRISAETHYMYEAMAAPVVLAEQIMQDLAYTSDTTRSRIWNVPQRLQPNEGNAGSPTKNLIGWNLAIKLSTEQIELIESANISVDGFSASNTKFQLNNALFERVSNIVRGITGAIKLKVSNYKSNIGSEALTQWQQLHLNEPVNYDRSIQYSEGIFRQMNFGYEDRELTVAVMINSFRIQKENIKCSSPYCCYDFNEYTEVPDSWKNTRNTIFNYVNAETWKLGTFRTAFIEKDRIHIQLRKMLNEVTITKAKPKIETRRNLTCPCGRKHYL